MLVMVFAFSSAFLAYQAGYLGTKEGEKGTWRNLYEEAEKSSAFWRDEWIDMKASRDSWEAKFWEINGSLGYTQKAYLNVKQDLGELRDDRDKWEAAYYNRTRSLKQALDEISKLQGDLRVALGEAAKWKSEYESMKADRDEWESQYWSTKHDLKGVQAAYDAKVDELATMTKDRDRWRTMYGEMKKSRDDWESSYWNTTSLYTQLTQNYSALSTRYSSLRSVYTALENDFNDLSVQFSELDGDYADLESSYKTLESNWDAYVDWYRLRSGNYPEATQLITPENRNVKSQSASILGWFFADGDLTWTDMRLLHSWVANHIEYNYDTAIWDPYWHVEEFDYWQSPSRTLSERRGDCEDQANLLLSLFLAEEDVEWAYCAAIEFEDGGMHVAIFIDVQGDEMYIYDPTWNWHSNGSGPETSKLAEYGQRAGSAVKRIHAVYNDKTYKTFATLGQFIDWF